MQSNPPQPQAELVNESSTFVRLPNGDGAGNDYLEVRVTSRLRMPNGVQHDVSDSFVLGGQDALDTLASLKMIHSNIKMLLMKAQQDQETAAAANADSTEPQTEDAEFTESE